MYENHLNELFLKMYTSLNSKLSHLNISVRILLGQSIVHHLIEIIHHTCLALENYETTCHMFYDISKAFGRVWPCLILKLEKYGIHGNLLAWFANYLLNRSQSVCVDVTYSSKQYIIGGVPQGSIWALCCFNIYKRHIRGLDRYD